MHCLEANQTKDIGNACSNRSLLCYPMTFLHSAHYVTNHSSSVLRVDHERHCGDCNYLLREISCNIISKRSNVSCSGDLPCIG